MIKKVVLQGVFQDLLDVLPVWLRESGGCRVMLNFHFVYVLGFEILLIRLRKHAISARYEFQESLHIDISVEY